jgi:hypothetical protein
MTSWLVEHVMACPFLLLQLTKAADFALYLDH